MSDRTLESRGHLNIVKKYYLAGGDLYFQAGNGLFKVHRYFFDRESTKFQEMLSRPPPTGQSVYGSLNNPIVLDVSSEDFQSLLWVFYNPMYSYEEAKLEDWAIILNLACRFKFPEVKKLAIRHLEKIDLELVERISLYQECSADEDVLIPLYAQLCARDRTLSLVETHKLGYETAVMVFQAREHLRSPSDRGKSPLPDDVEEGEVEDTIRDLMKDLFIGSDHRCGIRRSISGDKYDTQRTQNTKSSQDFKTRPPSRRAGWTEPEDGDDYGSFHSSDWEE
ncbi:hypothetical protein BT96DRAFT_451472 [Gymnopus androsaceus JB14]|uniref:BTB domain-containing protein n=1 Tax=Gymnopus androsaceus JB14 TaxID=1447944 RepID=A0A6A4I035_9AGAR|nr:hypothetical protein BT96DRAFT_451472 [Gymnopus androsaceus JB14]